MYNSVVVQSERANARPMIRLSLALTCAAATVALAGPATAQVAADRDLAAVSAHLRAVQTMTANFSQTDRAGKMTSGKLILKRPGKIRFQYQPGVPILIVGDGKALNFIDYSVGQLSRWPIGNSPLGVLLDPSRDLTRFAKVIPTGDPRTLLTEVRDPKHREYGVITIAFVRDAGAPAGLRLQGWVTLDAQNNRTTLRLSDQRFNVPVGDEAFRFNDPRRGVARR
jgi:outer membrane lipoprotein-sorting protein